MAKSNNWSATIGTWKFSLRMCVAVILALALIGCENSAPSKPMENQPNSNEGAAQTSTATHVHPEKGPHEGDLIELGAEEYHAELVHRDALVTIYILDATGKVAVPIDATELVINLSHEGKPEQYKLAAVAQTGDPAGKSSRFELAHASLAEHIEGESAAAKLSVTINGTQYRGEIHHQHDHEKH